MVKKLISLNINKGMHAVHAKKNPITTPPPFLFGIYVVVQIKHCHGHLATIQSPLPH
jgi:hypothetical protein